MIRVAIVFIRSPTGDYFVHRRLPNKRVFPGLYGLGTGGTVEPNESPRQGATRELREEAGLSTPLVHVADFPFDSGGVQYTVHFFLTEAPGPIPNHDPEWSESGFRSEAEVRELIESGHVCPDTAECFHRLNALDT